MEISRSEILVKEPQLSLSWLPLQTPSGPSASFVCSNGHYGTLLDHTIAEDGEVSPSVECTGVLNGQKCDFHEHIKLIGWVK